MDHAEARRCWPSQAIQPICSWCKAQAMLTQRQAYNNDCSKMDENLLKSLAEHATCVFLKINL